MFKQVRNHCLNIEKTPAHPINGIKWQKIVFAIEKQ